MYEDPADLQECPLNDLGQGTPHKIFDALEATPILTFMVSGRTLKTSLLTWTCPPIVVGAC